MDVTYVDDFYDNESDSESTTLDDDEPAPKRKLIRCFWTLKETYESAAEAKEAVSSEAIWRKCSTKKCAAGDTIHFRCKGGKYQKLECPAQIYLQYHAISLKVSLHATNTDHANHESDSECGLAEETKDFIREKYSEGITTPEAILGLLRKKGMSEPKKLKVTYFLHTLRVEKYGSSHMCATEIKKWCEGKRVEPVDPDEPFLLAYHVCADTPAFDEQDLKVVMSTKRLLEMAKKSRMIQTDSTYKMTWQGYPVILIGTTDKNM